MSKKNLLKNEILNLIALSGRGDMAWEDELWLSSLWPGFCLLIFGLECGVDSCEGKGLVGSLLCMSCLGSGPHSPLENLPVLPVKKHLSFYSVFSFSPEEDLQSQCPTGKAQLYTDICIYVKAFERVKGTKQDLMQKSSKTSVTSVP